MLFNNSNYGYDCRNNLDNCTFKPIIDKVYVMSCLKKYVVFDKKVSSFVNFEFIKNVAL